MANETLDTKQALDRLKAHGAGRGLFEGPPSASNESLIAVMVEEAEQSRPKPPPDAPKWFLPLVGISIAGILATAVSAVLPRSAAVASAQPRAREHAIHELARRGLYVDIDLEDVEFYDEAQPAARADRSMRSAPTAAAAVPPASVAHGNGLADLSGFGGVGFAPRVAVSPMQTSAAKREASFLDLARQVRRRCRSEAEAAPSNVLVRAHVVVGKNGSASEVRLDGSSGAVASCVEREIRSYPFSSEAALSTIDVPFSWRKQ